MPLKLMYITNNTDIALIAESVGVDRIFVDLEKIGKKERQGGMDTVQSDHTLKDIRKIRNSITKAEVLVRSNPVHPDLKNEIDNIIENGADIIMLPYFKGVEEVETFLKYVDNRIRTCVLFETTEAVDYIDDILKLDGIDEAFIGLNDLSISYGKNFMFELLADGTVEKLCLKFKLNGIPYGFGGISSIGTGVLPAENILKEHYRLDSESVILSRSFCNTEKISDLEKIRQIFYEGVKKLRLAEQECIKYKQYFYENQKRTKEIVAKMTEE